MTPMAQPDDHRRLLLVALAISIMALLFYLGAQPLAAGLFPAPWDKLAHFAVYGTLTALLQLGTASTQTWRVLVLVGIIGGLDEWHQMYIPGRAAELGDWLTDVSAAFITIIACECYMAHRVSADPPSRIPG